MATQRTESNPVEAASKPAVLLSSATEKLIEEKAESKVRPQDRKPTWESTTQSPLHFAFLFSKGRKQAIAIDYPVIDVNTRLARRWN
jgi:hypothetical protein